MVATGADVLPYSIAVPLVRARDARERDPATRWEALVHLHDAIVRTLALLAVSAYVAQDTRIAAVDKVLRDTALGPRVSTGQWYEIVNTVLVAWARSPDQLALPALVRAWADAAGTPTSVAAKLAGFIPLRNRNAHPGITDDEKLRLLPGLTADFNAIVDGLAVLASWRIAAVARATWVGTETRVDEIVECVGTRLVRVPAALTIRGTLDPDELLLLDGDRVVVRLYPMFFAELDEELFVYDANRRAARTGTIVSRLDYIGVASLGKVSVNRSHSMARTLETFTTRMAPWLAREVVGELEHVDRDVVFSGMPEAVARAGRDVVGRTALLDHVDAARWDSGGTLLIEAAPGAGKTAALAAIALRKSAAAVHLVGSEGGRDDVRLVARALLAQLCATFGHRHRTIPDDLGGALKAFHDALRELGDSGQRVLVVIDALDELRPASDGRPDVSLIPGAIPNVLVVVSARPGELATRVVGLGAKRVELGRLDQATLMEIARTRAPLRSASELASACASAEGNPLFLATLLEVERAVLPATLEDAFAAALKRVRDANPRLDLARALGLLAAARSGLSRRDLGRLLGAPFEAKEMLATLRAFLVDRGERLAVFHGRLREWLVDEYVGSDGMRTHHAAIADLLLADLGSGREDALADLPWHLERAGRAGEILDLLDGDFLAAKAAHEGGVEAVRADLLVGVRAAGGDVVRAARYGMVAALLARGARAFAGRGITARLARGGDPRIAAALAGVVPDPVERDAALAGVASATARLDLAFAHTIAATISDRELRTRTEAALAAGGEHPSGEDDLVQLRADAAEALALIDRVLHVRTLAAAALGLEPGHATPFMSRAITLALGADGELRGVLLAIAAEPVAKLGRDAARGLLQAVPGGLDRGRALAAAGLLDDAAQQASLVEGADRDAILVEVALRTIASDPEAAFALAQQLGNRRDRDRALLAIATTHGPLAVRAANLLEDPVLRAGALAELGLWDDAARAAARATDGEDRVAAEERLALAAVAARDTARATKHRDEAQRQRGTLAADRQAASFREAAAIAASGDATHAAHALARAAQLDASHGATRDTLLRGARLALARPSGAALVRSIDATAPFGDAFADLFPDFVGALADGFGASQPDAVLAAVEALRAAERQATFVLLAGLRDSVEPPLVPGPLAPGIIDAIARAEWSRPARPILGPAAEADLLARHVEATGASRDVDRLVDLRLAFGDRAGAVTALLAAVRHGTLEVADRARARARVIDPLDPRLAPGYVAPTAVIAPVAAASNARVLLCVDDSATIQRMMAITFEPEWRVIAARSLAEARQHIGASPAIVIAEPELPDGSGYDLASEFPRSHTVILFGATPYDDARGTAAGIAGSIKKPWDSQTMVEKIEAVLDATLDARPAGALQPRSAPSASPPRSATIMGMPTIKMPSPTTTRLPSPVMSAAPMPGPFAPRVTTAALPGPSPTILISCASCGASAPIGVEYCDRCGVQLQAALPPAKRGGSMIAGSPVSPLDEQAIELGAARAEVAIADPFSATPVTKPATEILFSLENLALLAGSSPAPAAGPSTPDDGLVDIRAMSPRVGSSPRPAAQPGAHDLPVFAGAGFSAPVTLRPDDSKQRARRRRWIAAGSVISLAAAFMLVFFVVKHSNVSESDPQAEAARAQAEQAAIAAKVRREIDRDEQALAELSTRIEKQLDAIASASDRDSYAAEKATLTELTKERDAIKARLAAARAARQKAGKQECIDNPLAIGC